MKIKILSIILVLAISIMFCGCGENNQDFSYEDVNKNDVVIYDNESGESLSESEVEKIIEEIKTDNSNTNLEETSKEDNDENTQNLEENNNDNIDNSVEENLENTEDNQNENFVTENETENLNESVEDNKENNNNLEENNEENNNLEDNNNQECNEQNIEENNNLENNNNQEYNEQNIEENNNNNKENLDDKEETSKEDIFTFVFTSRNQSNCDYDFANKEITLSLSEDESENIVRFKAYIYKNDELNTSQRFAVGILDSENYEFSVTVNNIYIEIKNACDFYVVLNCSYLNLLEVIHIIAV